MEINSKLQTNEQLNFQSRYQKLRNYFSISMVHLKKKNCSKRMVDRLSKKVNTALDCFYDIIIVR